MMNAILTSTLLILSKATECQNYVQSDSKVYPVGQCYEEAVDPNDQDWSSYIFLCENDGNNGLQAVEYEVGSNCDITEKVPTNRSYSCNGPDAADTCSCQLNGDGSECLFYEISKESMFNDTNTSCSDLAPKSISRYIVNICIEYIEGIFEDLSRSYSCNDDGDYIISSHDDSVCGSDGVDPVTVVPEESDCYDYQFQCAGSETVIVPTTTSILDTPSPTESPTSSSPTTTTTKSQISTPTPTNDANSIYHIIGFFYVFLFAIYFAV